MAKDKTTSRTIIVKELTISQFGNVHPMLTSRFLKSLHLEFEHYKTIQHNNLVQYFGAVKRDETLEILQEYMKTPTLLAVIKKHSMLENEPLLAKYSQDILLGLEFLHSKDLIHGNIKAANVFVRSDNTCVLADFGSVKMTFEELSCEMNSIVPHCTSPEQTQNDTRSTKCRF